MKYRILGFYKKTRECVVSLEIEADEKLLERLFSISACDLYTIKSDRELVAHMPFDFESYFYFIERVVEEIGATDVTLSSIIQ